MLKYTLLLSYFSIAVIKNITKTIYKTKCLIGFTVSEDGFMIITAGNMAVDVHDSVAVAENLHLYQ